MKIAVLGAGNIGGAVGKKWAAAGHQVTYGVRNPADADNVALAKQTGHGASVASVAAAVADVDAVLLAIPGPAVAQAIAPIAGKLAGKILIDATNSMGGATMNSVGALQQAAPTAHVFRAFNSVGWENFQTPMFGEVQADLFYAGPDGEPRTAVEQLISDVGLRPVRLGGPDKIPVVDSVATIWFALAMGERKGRHVAFKVLGI